MEPKPPYRVVILASGEGSNFSALAEAIQQTRIPNATLVALVCNKPEAPVISKAQRLGIRVVLIESKPYLSAGRRQDYDAELTRQVEALRPDWICLAGYMLVLGPGFIRQFPGKILNVHPSLLPKYKGLHALKQALEAGEKEAGCSVHWVTETVDDGGVVAQRSLAIERGDTEATLAARLKPYEHELFVEALSGLCKSGGK